MLRNPQIVYCGHELKAFSYLLAVSVKIGSFPALHLLDVATPQALTLCLYLFKCFVFSKRLT